MLHYLNAARARMRESLPDILKLRKERVQKDDGSYVTTGDLAMQEMLLALASKMLPEARIVSEERSSYENAGVTDGEIIVIDPIDGTENFTIGLPMWGVAISCFRSGRHEASMLACPELNEWMVTGEVGPPIYQSRVRSLSSSLSKEEILDATSGYEYRILGCCVYNMMSVIRGSFRSFENPKGAWSWDILPGLNLALEAGLPVIVEDQSYAGQYLTPDRKYRFKVGR